MKRNIAEDFRILSSKGSIDVSFHMMAINCRLFHEHQFPEKRYETYVPAPPDILKAFVECVYNLALDPESINPAITSDNLHYLMLLAEEFECPLLQEIITKRTHELRKAKEDQVSDNIERLAMAIEAQQNEVGAQIERVLAEDIGVSLTRLKEMPISRIPLSSLHRIIAMAIEKNPGMHMDRLLCDFILTKLDNEDSPEVCTLVNFLHIDRLSWEQVEHLFRNKRLENWLCHDFPVRFLHEMIAAVTSQQQQFEAQMIQHVADLQAANEEHKRLLEENVQTTKRELEARVSDVEVQVHGFNDTMRQRSSSVDRVTSQLQRDIENAKHQLSQLKTKVDDDCVKCDHSWFVKGFHCKKCGTERAWFS